MKFICIFQGVQHHPICDKSPFLFFPTLNVTLGRNIMGKLPKTCKTFLHQTWRYHILYCNSFQALCRSIGVWWKRLVPGKSCIRFSQK